MLSLLHQQRHPRGRHGARSTGDDHPVARATVPAIMIVLSVAPFTAARPAARSTTFSRAVQVRLDGDLLQKLERIEDHAQCLGRRDFTRSSMIRDAVAAYVAPLTSLLDRSGMLKQADCERLASAPDTGKGFSEVTRVRFNDDLVQQLDRIEAYARGLGFRHVTRSSLIRDGVGAYLTGFDAELSWTDSDQTDRHSLTEADRQ